ncbi:hypothetical protein [Streptomyces oceani]|uniref:Uncharacterized protein n=1 Tax=Streptomyces oceani TaxID=1075402 RepID=A0A1E7JXK3_9ACTN|nr:hypothetical protein [Streptomyces oceani]OEU96384.1 hypothetical protein AN216_20495 [Streptomyces oceani]
MEANQGAEHLNAGAANDTRHQTADTGGLDAMRDEFLRIASPRGLFGKVPNGAGAEEALERAAEDMLAEAERAGVSVENIVANAGTVADIADMTDEEAAMQARLAAAERPGGGAQMLLE